jgi:hypothetical protein
MQEKPKYQISLAFDDSEAAVKEAFITACVASPYDFVNTSELTVDQAKTMCELNYIQRREWLLCEECGHIDWLSEYPVSVRQAVLARLKELGKLSPKGQDQYSFHFPNPA